MSPRVIAGARGHCIEHRRSVSGGGSPLRGVVSVQVLKRGPRGHSTEHKMVYSKRVGFWGVSLVRGGSWRVSFKRGGFCRGAFKRPSRLQH